MYSYFKLTAQVSAYTMTYTEIDPPDPLSLVSATINLLRSRLWWLYMPMLDVGNFFWGQRAALSSCCYHFCLYHRPSSAVNVFK